MQRSQTQRSNVGSLFGHEVRGGNGWSPHVSHFNQTLIYIPESRRPVHASVASLLYFVPTHTCRDTGPRSHDSRMSYMNCVLSRRGSAYLATYCSLLCWRRLVGIQRRTCSWCFLDNLFWSAWKYRHTLAPCQTRDTG